MRPVPRAKQPARRRLILASASPARLATLRAAGIEPTVIVSGVDEDDVREETAAQHALTLARRKALAVKDNLGPEPALVLGCDSVLELAGEILGKPGTPKEAVRRWRQMRGHTGVLHTGHCVVDAASGQSAAAVGSTLVHFADVTDAEIEAYVDTGEPLAVAGGFTIDGLGGGFVERIEGDHHNVVGLSLPLLRRLLAELGVAWPDLWTKRP
jgi:septum formation protein